MNQIWRFYLKWLVICSGVAVVTLAIFAGYFIHRYPQIRKAHFDEGFEAIEERIMEEKMAKGLAVEPALETVARARRMMKEGDLDLQDFSELKVLNQIPEYRAPNSREYDELFQEMNRILDEKEGRVPISGDSLPSSSAIPMGATPSDVLEATPETSQSEAPSGP